MTGRSSTSVADSLQVLAEDAAAHRAPPGPADVRARRPVTVSTTFLWFSMTKIMTATAAMMLADRALWIWTHRSSSTFPGCVSCADLGR